MVYTILSQSLAYALLSSLWQSALLALVAWLVFKFMPRLSARMRYNMLTGLLLGTVVWFALTWYSQAEKLSSAVVQVTLENGAIRSSYIVPAQQADSGSNIATGFYNVCLAHTDWVLSLYLLGMLLMSFRVIKGTWQINSLRKSGLNVPEMWQMRLDAWAEKFGITRQVLVQATNKIDAPAMLGLFKPVILIPVALLANLPEEQLETILLHELAHIRRNDYLVNLFQVLLETVFFFNPFVWLLSGHIREVREHCCDDMVLEYMNPLQYAMALASLQQASHTGKLAMAATGNKKQLLTRIKRIIEMKRNDTLRGRWGLLAVMLVAAISIVVLTPTFAKNRKKKTTVQTNYVYKYITTDSAGKITEIKTEERSTPDGSLSDVHIHIDTSVAGSRKVRKIVISTDEEVAGLAGVADSINLALAEVGKELEGLNLDDININLSKADLDALKLKIDLAGKNKARHIKTDDDDDAEVARAVAKAGKSAKDIQVKTMSISLNSGKKGFSVSADSDFEDLLNDLEKEGLVDRKGNFSISKQNGTLYINGVKQSADVMKKYGSLEGLSKLNISGNRKSISISIEK